MKISEIGYLTEIIKPYTSAIHGCQTIARLLTVLESWKELCPDALSRAQELRDDATWQWVLKHKKQARYAGKVVEIAGPILLPRVLMLVGLTATQFKVPEGLAFIQLREGGHLE